MRLPAFEDLSKEQDLIYNLDLDGNYLVSGPPGSGKSIMALYRAQVLTFDDREPTLLMYNNVLQQYTDQAAASLGLAGHVRTFHKWIWGFWRHHFKQNPPLTGSSYDFDWSEIATQFFASPSGSGSLADLLVDEGQDLPLTFFRLARFFAQNITVFADENQQLSDRNTTLTEIASAIGAHRHLELKKNYRNTAEIAAVAAKFYAGAPTGLPDPPTRRGEMPTVRRYASDADLADFIARYVKTRSHLAVGIACENTTMQRRLYQLLEQRKPSLPVQMYISGDNRYRALDFDSPAVTLVNFRSLKGLEFDTLFVPELQQHSADPTSAATRMMFYVAVSRARDELHFSYSGPGDIPPILGDVTSLVREI